MGLYLSLGPHQAIALVQPLQWVGRTSGALSSVLLCYYVRFPRWLLLCSVSSLRELDLLEATMLLFLRHDSAFCLEVCISHCQESTSEGKGLTLSFRARQNPH